MRPHWLRTGFFASAALLATVSNPAQAAMVISEFLAVNDSGLLDEDGTRQDWVELHNSGPAGVNLAGYYLTDNAAALTKWQLPAVTLPAGGYLVVFASDKNRTNPANPLHTNFRLGSGGEYLGLVTPGGVTVVHDYAPAFPPQLPDVSYGLASNLISKRCFVAPTPGAANDESTTCGQAAAPSFSAERGFHDAPFSLTLASATPAAQIYYTTDGSQPDPATGILYSSPFSITGTTIVRAASFGSGLQASASITQSYIFLDDVLAQGPDAGPKTWPSDYEMDPDIVNHPVYGAEIVDDLKALPTISIAMDMDDLFGDSNGIYSHPGKQGDEWERPASAELIRTDGVEGFQINCGVRIQGDVSRDLNKKKSLRLDFQSIYGPSQLDYPFFPGSPLESFEKIRLRASHQESFSYGWRSAVYVRDQWARDTQLAMGRTSSHGIFVHVYLNGLYWGVYNAVERPDEDFAASYLGGNPEEWDVIKHGPEIVNGDDMAWKAANALAAAGLETPSAYAAIQQLVDVPNLIDYILLNLYAGTTDWDTNNYYLARRRDPGAGFVFFSWDTEISMKSIRDNRVTIDNSGKPSGIYAALRDNAEFRVLFGDHVQRHLFNDGALTPRRASDRFQARIDEIHDGIVAESARWGDTSTLTPLDRDDEWLIEVERLRLQYFPQRGDMLLGMLRAAELYPSISAPAFGQHGGLFAAGFVLEMTAAQGTIHYTLDGADPRLPGGAPAASAAVYSGPVALAQSATVKARVRFGTEWSALNEAAFVKDTGLRITEIMFHPADPPLPDTRSDDDFEFVEIRNVGSASAALAGVTFTEGIGFTFASGTLAPGSQLLLVGDLAAFESRYGTGHLVAGTFSGSLGNSGERLRLEDATGGALHDFEFQDEWAPSADGSGRSLVIRDPNGDIATWVRADGWRASALPGGSPGAAELPVCNDAADNDGDGLVDLADPGCADASSPEEDPECEDGQDNDDDGEADASDPDCSDPSDADEAIDLVDSFVCYSTVSYSDAGSPVVSVNDDISGDRATSVGDSRAICLPAAMGGIAVENANVSLQLYNARDESGLDTPTAKRVLYTALGPIYIDRGTPNGLLVPAAMDPDGPTAAPSDASHRLDRYKCYRASASTKVSKYFPREVKLTTSDDFEQRVYDLRKPSRLCMPAGFDGGSVREPRGGFLCYGVKLSSGQLRHTARTGIHTADELGSLQQDTRRATEVCIPLR